MAGTLFGAMFSTAAMSEAVSGQAWVRAMLEVEGALARAEARAGVIPQAAADAIVEGCRRSATDPAGLAADLLAVANPAGPLIRAVSAGMPADVADWLHWGATSQDIVDSALVLIVQRGIELLLSDLDRACGACAHLAEQHRGTMMAGRTLLQQAVPITFGLKSAGWLTALLDTRVRLAEICSELPVQLGGAAGTLAAFGAEALTVMSSFAEELGLREPALPWHTSRRPVVEVACELGIACGVAGKIALDVALLAQTEVGELREGGRPGASSAMPQKRNPSLSITINACVRQAQAIVPVMLQAMIQEHERAAGAWQTEWTSVSRLLELSAATLSHAASLLEGLEVDPARMRMNLAAGEGRIMAESLFVALGRVRGKLEARRLVDEAVDRSISERRSLEDAALSDPGILGVLGSEGVREALRPEAYLGESEAFIDRALAYYRAMPKAEA